MRNPKPSAGLKLLDGVCRSPKQFASLFLVYSDIACRPRMAVPIGEMWVLPPARVTPDRASMREFSLCSWQHGRSRKRFEKRFPFTATTIAELSDFGPWRLWYRS